MYSDELSNKDLFAMKGELTYNIEVLNARLIEVNKQIAARLQKEASDVQVPRGQENVLNNGSHDNPGCD